MYYPKFETAEDYMNTIYERDRKMNFSLRCINSRTPETLENFFRSIYDFESSDVAESHSKQALLKYFEEKSIDYELFFSLTEETETIAVTLICHYHTCMFKNRDFDKSAISPHSLINYRLVGTTFGDILHNMIKDDPFKLKVYDFYVLRYLESFFDFGIKNYYEKNNLQYFDMLRNEREISAYLLYQTTQEARDLMDRLNADYRDFYHKLNRYFFVGNKIKHFKDTNFVFYKEHLDMSYADLLRHLIKKDPSNYKY